jgi:hypothetical protein
MDWKGVVRFGTSEWYRERVTDRAWAAFRGRRVIQIGPKTPHRAADLRCLLGEGHTPEDEWIAPGHTHQSVAGDSKITGSVFPSLVGG